MEGQMHFRQGSIGWNSETRPAPGKRRETARNKVWPDVVSDMEACYEVDPRQKTSYKMYIHIKRKNLNVLEENVLKYRLLWVVKIIAEVVFMLLKAFCTFLLFWSGVYSFDNHKKDTFLVWRVLSTKANLSEAKANGQVHLGRCSPEGPGGKEWEGGEGWQW